MSIGINFLTPGWRHSTQPPANGARHLYRGEDELTRTSKGTGIGLALVQGLVEEMGGAVRGRNVRGGGFEVAISLAA